MKCFSSLSHRFFLIIGLVILSMFINSCSIIPKKHDIIKSLINSEYDYSKTLLDKMVKRYNTLELSEKCDYHYFNGCYFYSIKEYDQAEDEFNKCLELNPSYLQALNSRARLRNIHLGNYSGAIQDYKKIIEFFDYCKSIQYFNDNYLITLYTISGIDKSKIPPDILEEVIKANRNKRFRSITMEPDVWKIQCYRDLVICYQRNHEIRKAINCINELMIKERDILIWEKHDYFKRYLGTYYLKLKEYTNAINAYKSYLKHNNDNYNIYYKIGLCYFHLEDFESSISELTTCLNLMRKIDLNLIETYTRSSDNKSVIKNNKKALKEHSELLVSVLSHRARSYGKLEEYEKSIIDLNEAINIDPNNENAYYYRGYFYKILGEKELALKDLLKVLEINPNMNSVNYSVAIIYDSKEDHKRAKEYYNEFIKSVEDQTSQKYIYSTRRLKIINKNINP